MVWAHYLDPEQIEYKPREVLAADLLLIGRVTYESFAGAWPSYTGEFTDKMNGMPKVVVSNTLTDPAWSNTTVLRGDVVGGVTGLKAQDGGPILVAGSKTLISRSSTVVRGEVATRPRRRRRRAPRR